MNCRYLSWTLSQFNSRNSFTQIPDIFSSCRQNLMHFFCIAWSRYLSFFEGFEKQAVQAWSKKGCISELHKSLRKGAFKKRFCLCRNLKRGFVLSITFKVIDSPETLSSKIHPENLRTLPISCWTLCCGYEFKIESYG